MTMTREEALAIVARVAAEMQDAGDGTDVHAWAGELTGAIAALAQPEWRPIAEAPRDGTEFDVWCPENCPPENGYRIANCWWCGVDGRFRYYGDERMQWAHQPTHWMPLPAPPEAA